MRIPVVMLAALLGACTPTPRPAVAPTAPAAEARAPVTMLVSIDGMHPDYLTRGVTPTLSRLAAEGVSGSLQPSFPTKTFPNHYTLVTGLHPDRHGIVANRFEDSERPGEVFTMATTDRFWWDQGEPIWVAAERAGIRTATMFWPGSNTDVAGQRPSDWQQFAQALPEANRVDAIVDWLRRPAATRPKLLTLYFDTVDTAGHRFGPQSAEVDAALAEADRQIGRLLAELAAMGQPVNLIVTSDHGMAPVSAERVIDLNAAMGGEANIRLVEDGPYAAFHAQPGRAAAVEARLAGPHRHMQCWKKQALPARLAYGRNPRVPPYLCIAESGWTILGQPPRYSIAGGAHGYDNADGAMRAAFVAHGPAFAPGTRVEARSVDVYPLLRQLVGLPAAQGRDGSMVAFIPTLRK
ncbi:alkaline phosphatase family protein [Sphingomonas baiyangensis]|uniref:Alkaline phosphatase family protein n=1 Tax=Sphingomonas baiyangensis TaxID=2572576 RepID=A0A4U1L4T9_9SPHN|nr:ectonucleotide pyrophosphatase/phosphodiesterase [Sphingomonas baiyangensis]TKD51260.1 alkaline phosphatase family protein [Sphingomonas baiyangensis]